MRVYPSLPLLLLCTATCSSPVTETNRRIITAWLVCDECVGGEQQRVVDRGAAVIPYLTDAIKQGPTRYYDSVSTLQARENSARTQRYRRDHQLVPMSATDSSGFVDSHREAFALTWRLRAAQALNAIDPVAARSG